MRFTLRHKIFLHFFIFMGINAVVWLMIYFNYNTMDKKLRLVEKKNDLFNIILEARRYEKNFFLRHDGKDLAQALTFAGMALNMQQNIADDFAGYIQDPHVLGERISEIRSYRNKLSALLEMQQRRIPKDLAGAQNEIARLGRRITSETERMENLEKEKLYLLLNQLKRYFILSLVALMCLSLITALFLAYNVNRPLKIIENGIKNILKGDYAKVPEIRTGDEFESLSRSLNNLIQELNRRSDQLVQAEKMSSLGTLTSGVAHELNNPLNNISTSVQIVLEELAPAGNDMIADLLSETEHQVDRARDIVRALLEFSRQSDFSIRQHNFKKLVQDTLMLIKGDIPADIDITVDIPDNIFGRFDFNRIQQVLLNLIINGTHAMEHGGEITIRAYEESNQEMFSFQVIDTGTGIDPDHLNRIFDPFFTTKEVGKGSGLGLSIIHGIVEKHNGHIKVDSEIGTGTTFTVSLPMLTDDWN